MNKEQFIEILSGFIAPRLVEALVEQAEGKGYFIESTFKCTVKTRSQLTSDELELVLAAEHLAEIKHLL